MEDLEEEEHRINLEQTKARVEAKKRTPIREVEVYGQHRGAGYGGDAYQSQ